jgi:hypothetical protein
VTPDFLDGAATNLTSSVAAWNRRRHQHLTGLDLSDSLHRKLESQEICPDSATFTYSDWLCADGEAFQIRINATTGQTISSTPVDSYPNLVEKWNNGTFSKRMSPLECLNTYSNPFGNRSDVVMIADYDYLAQEHTTATNASNSLLFMKQLRIAMEMGFWNEYDWRCGTTNSFDCEYGPNFISIEVR